jgi:hypothetical protein
MVALPTAMMRSMETTCTEELILKKELLKKALHEQSSRKIRRGLLLLVGGVALCYSCVQLAAGPMPELTLENMFQLDDPGIRFKYGMWASLLVAYIGGLEITVHYRLLKKLKD